MEVKTNPPNYAVEKTLEVMVRFGLHCDGVQHLAVTIYAYSGQTQEVEVTTASCRVQVHTIKMAQLWAPPLFTTTPVLSLLHHPLVSPSPASNFYRSNTWYVC